MSYSPRLLRRVTMRAANEKILKKLELIKDKLPNSLGKLADLIIESYNDNGYATPYDIGVAKDLIKKVDKNAKF